ncbi:transposase [Parabacteroides distasonis]|uniref:transposase n=1 Tax=Parabacteroides distasonis TaxID=823 RepID=UPI001F2FA92B|nr:transposase [Parabacteroides distasonis]MCE9061216.1 transposase [Parabacteroides distasonis]
MSNKARERKSYSHDFKLRMLKEYYESGSTKYSLCKKYSVDYVTFSRWEGYFESKTLSLLSDLTELEHQVYMARKKSESSKATRPQTESERLREENLRLRKALSYSVLRNEALHELLKIGREQYGIDLLKKAGAKR